MNRENIFLGLALFLVVALTISSCKEEKKKTPEETKEIKALTIDATKYDKWVYVSFVQGKVVEISNYKNDLSWDMAIHRYDVRLNGGAAGKGQGAALETTSTELSALTSIPATGYVVDVMDSIMLSMPPTYDYQPINHEASKWMSLNTSSMPPTYELSNKVYVFKTADGKHVKIKFLDYLNAENKSGYIKFSYVYMD